MYTNMNKNIIRTCPYKLLTVLFKKEIRQIYSCNKEYEKIIIVVIRGNDLWNTIPLMVIFKAKTKNEWRNAMPTEAFLK